MAPRRRKGARQFRRPDESLFSYPAIKGATIAFCLVALFGMVSGFFRMDGGSIKGHSSSISKRNVFKSTDNVSDALLGRIDAILVLGGGRPSSFQEPPVYVQERCDDAAALVKRYQALNSSRNYRHRNQKSLPILCLSAGTAHLPQLLAADGLPVWEATASAAYLAKQHGIHDENLYVETTSYDTIGNAFYARTGHTDVNGWRRLLIITNEFHMNRTIAIFDWIFGLSTANHDGVGRSYELHYLSSKNVGLSDKAVAARREREETSLAHVRDYAQKYTTLSQVYEFLTTQHGLYTAAKLVERASSATSEASDLVKKSYGANANHRRLQQKYSKRRTELRNPVADFFGRLFRS